MKKDFVQLNNGKKKFYINVKNIAYIHAKNKNKTYVHFVGDLYKFIEVEETEDQIISKIID